MIEAVNISFRLEMFSVLFCVEVADQNIKYNFDFLKRTRPREWSKSSRLCMANFVLLGILYLAAIEIDSNPGLWKFVTAQNPETSIISGFEW